MFVFKKGNHQLFEDDRRVAQTVSEILLDLDKNGMNAVRKYSKQFDDWNPASFELNNKEIQSAIDLLDNQVIQDTDYCQSNVRQFAQAQMTTLLPLEVEIREGVTLGHKHIPVNCVGCYIPGGRYPMFGSAQMSIIPARVAGVKHVVACTPPTTSGSPRCYPATINAIKKAGADRIFVVGGIQAMALMAFGMDEVEPADILCGAGNRYVTEAKRQLFGRCGVDLLAGPTEIMIIADNDADPVLVACDLLGQAEHDPNSGICLICFSEKFARKTISEVNKQLETLPTKKIAEASWNNNGQVCVVENSDEAILECDKYAPEHLELHVSNLDKYFHELKNYGSLFIGEETTVAYGDKSIGTNHILPTSRSARFTGGLWVGKFLKTCTYQKMNAHASAEIGMITYRQCEVEKMYAHGLTAKIRVDRYS